MGLASLSANYLCHGSVQPGGKEMRAPRKLPASLLRAMHSRRVPSSEPPARGAPHAGVQGLYAAFARAASIPNAKQTALKTAGEGLSNLLTLPQANDVVVVPPRNLEWLQLLVTKELGNQLKNNTASTFSSWLRR